MKEDWEEIIYKDAVYKISTSKQKLKQKQYLKSGLIPIVDQGQDLIGGYTNDENRVIECDLPVLVFGDHTKITKLIDFKFAPGADGTKILEPSKFVLPEYLSILTKVLTFKIKDNGYARHYQHIEKELLPLAPLTIQRAIVSKIEALFSDLDNGIANFKKAQEQLKVYRQAVLKKAFEGGFSITNEEFRITNSENHSSDNLPKGWTKDIVKNVALNIQYGYTESSSQKAVGPKFLRITDIQDYKVNWNDVPYCQIRDEEKSKYLLEDGDLVFARTGATVGKSFLIKGNIPESVFASYLIRLRFPKTINDKYVWYFFHSPMYWSQIINKQVGTGQPNVNGTKLGQLELVLPPTLAEQTQIVQEIESRLSVTDNLEIVIRNSIEKAEALRQSILKKAFEGKLLSEAEIEQCKAAADYEPASELLKKIQAEKAERITNGKLRITKKGQKTGIRN